MMNSDKKDYALFTHTRPYKTQGPLADCDKYCLYINTAKSLREPPPNPWGNPTILSIEPRFSIVDGLVPICRQFRTPRGCSDRQNWQDRPICGVMRPGEAGNTTSANSADSLGSPLATQVGRICKIGPSPGL